MESGETTETLNEDLQPVDAVVVDTEITKDIPQSEASADSELYVDDDEGDQEKPKTNMSQQQAYAAFRKEQEKRKRKNEELDKEKAERERLQREVDELKSVVGSIKKGKPPTYESCDYDEKAYQTQMAEYYNTQSATPTNTAKQEEASPANTRNEQAEFYLYQSEQALTKALPEYDDAKLAVSESLRTKCGVTDVDGVMVILADIAMQNNIDIAKALLAMNKVPSLVDELNRVGNNQFGIAKVLEKAASRVKTRSAKVINTQPEPEINHSGPVDSSTAAITKLRNAWVKNPNTANYNTYQAAKQKGKS